MEAEPEEEMILVEGKSGMAKLKERYGIVPRERDSKHKGHPIGYSEKKKGWCGWSHRAFACFPVGHTVKEGHLPARFRGRTVKNEKDSEDFAAAFAREVS
jgi:hypothetical protein